MLWNTVAVPSKQPEVQMPFPLDPPGSDRHEQARRLGIALGSLRRAVGIDIGTLAALSGLSGTSIRGWEDGRQIPKPSSTAQLLVALASQIAGDSVEQAVAEIAAHPRAATGAAATTSETTNRDEDADLTVALRRWAEESRKWPEPVWLEPLLGRLGWTGPEQIKLEKAAELAGGKSKQAADQQQRRLMDGLRVTPGPSQMLDRVAGFLWDLCPTTTARASEALLESGLSDVLLSVEGILEACAIAGLQDLPVVKDGALGTTAEEAAAHARLVDAVTKRARTPVPMPLGSLGDLGESELPAELLRELLDGYAWIRWLQGDWFVDLESITRKSTLVTMTRKLLAACGPLSLDAVVRGLQRPVKHGRLDPLPPEEVLERFLVLHPDFSVSNGKASVTASSEDLLSPSERLAVQVIGGHGGIASYAQLKAAFKDVGMSAATVGQLTQFSPILMRRHRDEWTLRSDGAEMTGLTAPPSADYARRLREARLAGGLSQQAVADRLNADQPTISNWERGRSQPPPSAKRALRELLGVAESES